MISTGRSSRTYRKECVGKIHAQVDCLADESQVDEITPSVAFNVRACTLWCVYGGSPDKPERHEVVRYELVEVFARLLEFEEENDELMAPV